MSRDHARTNYGIWSDDDFRALPSSAQWLYFALSTNIGTSFAGVSDWRPLRIAALSGELDAPAVEHIAAGLERPENGCEPFLVVDRDTEEALLRSFIKHDGLLKHPNMTQAMITATLKVTSTTLRAVIVDQLIRLREKEPTLVGWLKVDPSGLLERPSLDASDAVDQLPLNPSPTLPRSIAQRSVNLSESA